MLKSKVLRTSAGAWEYLTEGTTGKAGSGYSEYYLGEQPIPPRSNLKGRGWLQLERQFGISFSDGLTKQDFEALAAGKSPTGKVLVPPMKGIHTPGFDSQCSPPKSFSTAFVDATDSERKLLELMHLKSAHATADYIESHARGARIKRDGVKVEETGEMLFMFSTHHTSRPNETTKARGTAGDPQLHTHMFGFNMQWADGKWRAVEHRAVVKVQRAAEAIYTLSLLDELEKNNIAYVLKTDRKGRNSFELAGSDPRVNDFFSTRSKEVQKRQRDFEREYHRPPTIAESMDLAREGRGDHDHTEPSWDDYARALDEADLPRPKINYETRHSAPLVDRRAEVLRRVLGPNGLTRQDKTFKRWEVPAEVLNACIGLLSLDEAKAFVAEFETSQELITVIPADRDPDYDELTTQTLLNAERRCIDRLLQKSTEFSKGIPEKSVLRSVARSSVPLTDQQVEAVKQVAGGRGLVILEGEAGTGKTTIFTTAKDAGDFDGSFGQWVAVAIAGSTAERSAMKIGATICGSVESLKLQVERGRKLTENDKVIFDESVMADTWHLEEFLKIAGHCKLVFVGDPAQLQAIGAGGIHVEVAERTDVVRLDEVFRQKHQWYIDACRAVRKQNGTEALQILADHGGFDIAPSHAESMGNLVATWEHYRNQGLRPDEVVVNTDQPNSVIDTLNRLIQDRRIERGELSGSSLTVICNTNNRTETFHAGDIVTFTKSVDAGTDGYVKNGKTGKIERVDIERGDVVVRVDHRSVRVALSAVGDQPLRLAYAGHATRMQGGEGEVVLVLPGRWQTDAVSGYSMITRGSKACHVFASHELHGDEPLAGLGAMWSKAKQKRTASRIVEIQDLLAEEVTDPMQEHIDSDDISISVKTIGWHMGQRIREEIDSETNLRKTRMPVMEKLITPIL